MLDPGLGPELDNKRAWQSLVGFLFSTEESLEVSGPLMRRHRLSFLLSFGW